MVGYEAGMISYNFISTNYNIALFCYHIQVFNVYEIIIIIFITISMYGTNNYNIGIYTLACSSVESAWLIFCFLVYLALLGGAGGRGIFP